MLQTILDIILYIPRKIEWYIRDYKYLKEEFKKQDTIIHNQNLVLKRITRECDYYMQMNQSVSYTGFKKVKELSQTFPNDTKF